METGGVAGAAAGTEFGALAAGVAPGGSMLLPVQYASPWLVNAQCSDPFVKVGVLVDLRQKSSPLAVA
jgi:hypothetical protein